MPVYLERFLLSASATAWPGWRADLIKVVEASVSMQVPSQNIHFLLENGKMVTPSGRLLSSHDRSVGRKIDEKPAVSRDRLITSFKA